MAIGGFKHTFAGVAVGDMGELIPGLATFIPNGCGGEGPDSVRGNTHKMPSMVLQGPVIEEVHQVVGVKVFPLAGVRRDVDAKTRMGQFIIPIVRKPEGDGTGYPPGGDITAAHAVILFAAGGSARVRGVRSVGARGGRAIRATPLAVRPPGPVHFKIQKGAFADG